MYTIAFPIFNMSFFFFQAEDGIRDYKVTGVQTCALPISPGQNRRGRPRQRGPGLPSIGADGPKPGGNLRPAHPEAHGRRARNVQREAGGLIQESYPGHREATLSREDKRRALHQGNQRGNRKVPRRFQENRGGSPSNGRARTRGGFRTGARTAAQHPAASAPEDGG